MVVKCIKSVFIGAALLIGSVALFSWALGFFFFFRDLRYYMGRHPLISLPAMAVIFIAGFRWQYLRARWR
jgi:hypothetical protein